MGSFISMLRGGPHDRPTGTGRPVRESDGTARFSKQFSDFILDLGDADSAKFEQEYFPEYAMILQRGPDLLRQLRAYVDSTQEIRTAITSPTAENEEAAWRKLGPSVMLLKDCYEHAQDIGKQRRCDGRQ
ncbi:hypothetical protein FBU59_000268 [Linderina macrospora]|uniref:Uncharacterized protein n=1 Tax=Linderina macrospora TaxID=4868 RepID=A0ACC1JHL8_9FUNG|nr:hypothetical protein FBU59_000268 [Linderina macrospora]